MCCKALWKIYQLRSEDQTLSTPYFNHPGENAVVVPMGSNQTWHGRVLSSLWHTPYDHLPCKLLMLSIFHVMLKRYTVVRTIKCYLIGDLYIVERCQHASSLYVIMHLQHFVSCFWNFFVTPYSPDLFLIHVCCLCIFPPTSWNHLKIAKGRKMRWPYVMQSRKISLKLNMWPPLPQNPEHVGNVTFWDLYIVGKNRLSALIWLLICFCSIYTFKVMLKSIQAFL